ncbi:MAG: DUF4291 domain-containing protein [Fibrobacterota bacterium]|nr:DUF4291 domain-containing protein [Fibrobacterota bacterium]QQS03858.1 MAG: DUF4291 domain-containing protein [Fibrobacterota bacterium]
MNLPTTPYSRYEEGLPQEGNWILGHRTGSSIFVYQAFNDRIADHAVQHQRFGGPHYSFSRMTWIKPNFLWMMYRCGWGAKDANQTRVLAIEMTFSGFEELLAQGVSTVPHPFHGDEAQWRQQLDRSDVRLQWDPDHDFSGAKLQRRAIQIGIKNKALEEFNERHIQSIQDITDFVKEQKKIIDAEGNSFLVVQERIIEVNNALRERFGIPG